MSEIKRIGAVWNDICESLQLRESPDGEFVTYENYAELKAQRDALAAENAALVRYLSASAGAIELWNSWADLEDKLASAPETPATDAYLNSVWSEGVEMFAKQFNCADINDEILDFAAQIRAGEPS